MIYVARAEIPCNLEEHKRHPNHISDKPVLLKQGTKDLRKIHYRVAAIACLVSVPAYNADAASISSIQAGRISQFANSLGVNVHMEYNDGAYASAAQATSDLNYLGIHQLRDGTPNPNGGQPYRNYLASISTLVGAGNRFEFFVEPGGQSLSSSVGQIGSIESAHPGSVIAIEGPNEINNFPVSYAGLSGNAAGEAVQRSLYSAVKGNSALASAPVYYFTGGSQINLAANPGLANDANAHPYPYQGQAPGPRIASEFQHDFSMPLPYARAITETGYFNQPHSSYGSGVDNATQEKLTLDLLFDAYQQGISKTFLYQLRSAYPDPQANNPDIEYGLFNLDNSPKPVATGIHNLTSILADTGLSAGVFTTGSLAYAISGLPATGQSLLFQSSNGTFDLVLWAEPTVWNEGSHSPVAAPSSTVTLTLRSPAQSVSAFDPMRQTSPIQQRSNTTTASVTLSDHPVILQIRQ